MPPRSRAAVVVDGVRAARPADAAAIAPLAARLDQKHALALPAFFRAGDAGDSATARVASLRLALARSTERWLVVETTGEIIAFARALIVETPSDPALRRRRRVHIDSLWVEPAARRHGHGRALVEAAAAWGRERGAEQVILTVWEGNPGALAFYERMGFATASRVMAREA